MTPARRLRLVLPLLLLAGCSTPEQRIQRNQELFDSLPVAAQARIRGGEIEIGFTPDMVRIALGEPARRLRRRDGAGETEIWLYLDLERRYDRQRADVEGLSFPGTGGLRTGGGSAWINVMQEREFIRARVEFRAGVVTAIEDATREPSRETPRKP